MLERLIVIKKHYDELNTELLKPEVLSNVNKTREISKQVSDYRDIVEHADKYMKVLNDIEEAKELLNDTEMAEFAKEELSMLNSTKDTLEDELELLLIPKDPNDDKNVIVEIRGAAGGDEANIFAGDLYRMYLRYAEDERFKVDVISEEYSEGGGFSLVSFMVKGKGAYSKLKYESGAHRVQRVPVTETQGRVHTSTATVLVMPEVEDFEVELNPNDIRVDIYRSSGKGGQGVNTTDSAVRLTHLPTGIVVTCQNERSQIQNKERAMQVLKSRIFDDMQAKRDAEIGGERKSKIGTGDRSEKIRTYNYPQNRITDHRIGFTTMNLDRVMEGDLEDVIQALINEDQKRKLSGE